MSSQQKIRIGTRGSKLALSQARLVGEQLVKSVGWLDIEFVKITTSGDIKQGAGEGIGRDKKDWIFEIEQSLLAREIDFAVHSAKDVPLEIAEGTRLVSVLEREDSRDALVLGDVEQIEKGRAAWEILSRLAPGSKIGCASLRRRAQIAALVPGLIVEPLRGNIPTRIARLEDGSGFAALVLAYAGLLRLGLDRRVSAVFSHSEMLPAAGQGILVAQYRCEDLEIEQALLKCRQITTETAWLAERSFVSVLGADCRSAVAVFSSVRGNELEIEGEVLAFDRRPAIRSMLRGIVSEPEELGRQLAGRMIDKGAQDYL